MSCLDSARVAQAATEGTSDPHFAECLRCRRLLEADRAVRSALAALPVPTLDAGHHRAIAAELMAQADALPVGGKRRRAMSRAAIAASSLAAACAIVIAWPASHAVHAPQLSVRAPEEPLAMVATMAAAAEPAPTLRPPLLDASDGATLRHVAGQSRDTVTLVEGTLDIDTRSARAADVRVGDTVVHVDNAAVTIRARDRAVASIRVVVGSARVVDAKHRLTLQRDSLWMPGPNDKQRSLEAFRAGWFALRAGRHREAIALFDLVTDPVAREEASYWAAVSAKRSGDEALAAERLANFHRMYPDSKFTTEENARSTRP